MKGCGIVGRTVRATSRLTREECVRVMSRDGVGPVLATPADADASNIWIEDTRPDPLYPGSAQAEGPGTQCRSGPATESPANVMCNLVEPPGSCGWKMRLHPPPH